MIKVYPQWIFTPEQRDEESGKIPDLVLEQVCKDTDGELYAKPWLCMEFKKLGGNPPYKAYTKSPLPSKVNWMKKQLQIPHHISCCCCGD